MINFIKRWWSMWLALWFPLSLFCYWLGDVTPIQGIGVAAYALVGLSVFAEALGGKGSG